MKIDNVCTKCGAPLDPDGYCSFHQPTRTVPTQVVETQIVNPEEGSEVGTNEVVKQMRAWDWVFLAGMVVMAFLSWLLFFIEELRLAVLPEPEMKLVNTLFLAGFVFVIIYAIKSRRYLLAWMLLSSFALRIAHLYEELL